jgi:hypothetical protein
MLPTATGCYPGIFVNFWLCSGIGVHCCALSQ